MGRALALIDGEHYAPVVREAIEELPYETVAAHLVGGTEKLRGGEEYGVPLVDDLAEAIRRLRPDAVVDLSDEPVLGPRERLALASRVLALGVPYLGADFRLDPPAFEPFAVPSLAVAGTGKRIGKTAIAGYAARTLAARRRVVVVAMGRGGPARPEVVRARPTLDDLVGLARAGRHAASDHLETAALSGVVTIGCRRCGGGLAGAPAFSNVGEGALLAAAEDPDLVVFDGSGAALPPVDVDRRVLVIGAGQDPAVATGYLNAYRILISDLVVLAGAEEPGTARALREAVLAVRSDARVIAAVLRPRPVSPVAGRSVAYFTTAPAAAHPRLAAHLRERHGARVVHVSGNLARRPELREELGRVEAEVYVIEIKAAAIDVVAEAALARGAEVVFADNDVATPPGEPDLAAALEELAGAAIAESGVAAVGEGRA